MFAKFRATYPTGQLISELVTVHNGKFVVRSLVQVGGVTVVTGLAAADTVESAEDAARARSLALLGLNASTPVSESLSVSVPPPPAAVLRPEPSLSSEQLSISQPSNFVNPQPPLIPPVQGPKPEPMVASVPPEVTQFDSDAWLGSSYSEPATQTPAISRPVGGSKSEFPLTPAHSAPETAIAESGSDHAVEPSSPTDNSEVIAQIDVLLKRLKWTKDQEGEYLMQAYGKRVQSLLPIEELYDFLDYLEIFGKTTEQIKRIGWGTKQGREYLELTYNKISRHHLTKEELLEFLSYLESQ